MNLHVRVGVRMGIRNFLKMNMRNFLKHLRALLSLNIKKRNESFLNFKVNIENVFEVNWQSAMMQHNGSVAKAQGGGGGSVSNAKKETIVWPLGYCAIIYIKKNSFSLNFEPMAMIQFASGQRLLLRFLDFFYSLES